MSLSSGATTQPAISSKDLFFRFYVFPVKSLKHVKLWEFSHSPSVGRHFILTNAMRLGHQTLTCCSVLGEIFPDTKVIWLEIKFKTLRFSCFMDLVIGIGWIEGYAQFII